MITLVLLFYGICLGSFVNALVWRLRKHREQGGLDASTEQMAAEPDEAEPHPRPLAFVADMVTSLWGEFVEWCLWPVQAARGLLASRHEQGEADKYSIATGRSMCPHCEHELAAKDLVPVLSWLWLRGKCRYCRGPISGQYPLVELLTGAIFAVSYLRWSHGAGPIGYVLLVLWLIMATGLVALALYDFKFRHLPNELLYPLLWLALVFVVLLTVRDGLWAVQTAAGGVLAIWGIFFVIFCVAEYLGKRWIGYGDVRLAVLIGLLVGGALNALLVIFVASVLGLLGSVPALVRGKADGKTQLPYGPFLVAATFVVVWFGDAIIHWYLALLAG